MALGVGIFYANLEVNRQTNEMKKKKYILRSPKHQEIANCYDGTEPIEARIARMVKYTLFTTQRVISRTS